MENKIAIVPCPPVKHYAVQPQDQSKCTKENCAYCGQEMWLSEKKKIIIMARHLMEKETWVGCYDCFLKTALEKSNSGDWDIREITKISI
jgi:hypothetical protein